MGLTHVTVRVGNPANGRKREVARCLVDSGAIYSLVPGPVLRRLGIRVPAAVPSQALLAAGSRAVVARRALEAVDVGRGWLLR